MGDFGFPGVERPHLVAAHPSWCRLSRQPEGERTASLRLKRGYSETDLTMSFRASPKALIYGSASIHERRKRILREARLMISELGYEKFNIRELAARADVAQKTLYNAFSSKEILIASSIIEYSKEFSDNIRLINDGMTLRGKLERLIRIHRRNLQIRRYTTAIMTLYNSPTADPTIRQAIRDLSIDGHIDWAEHLAKSRAFLKHVEARGFAQQIASITYCALTDWCVGEIPDDRMIERIAENVLIVVIGATRGAIRTEAETWLKAVRANGPMWRDLRAQVDARRRPSAGGESPATITDETRGSTVIPLTPGLISES